MKKRILVIFLLLALTLVLYLVLTSESAEKQIAGTPAENNRTASLENDYKPQAKELFASYEAMARDNNLNLEKISELKNKLLDLKVPLKFKKLHVDFVLALAKTEDYLNLKDEQERNASRQLVNQLKADYSWLNN